MIADKVIRKGASIEALLFANRENPAGPIAFIIGLVVSMWGFSNQSWYTGFLVKKHPGIGDIAFPVGFVIAFAIYYVFAHKKVESEK